MQRLVKASLLIIGILSCSALAFGQDTTNENYNAKFSSLAQEVGAGCGVFLPSSVPGITEVISLCGGRYAFKVGQQTVLESSFFDGNGHAQSYVLGAEDFRFDMPLDDLMASFYGGVDIHYATAPNYDVNGNNTGGQSKFYIGADLGTAIWVAISDSFNVRTDLKLLLSPGTSLFLGLSLVYRFDSAGGGG